MPRVPKAKVAAGAAAKKPPAGKKKNNLYARPEPIALGTVLADLTKTQWKIGPSIGTGGFGEIYSACKVGEKNYDYVVKCEPHGNGPLFVEMHFYMRNARLEDIARYKRDRGIKALGMPHMLGNGSHDINGQKHRFIVMPRYGSDIARFFVDNGRRLPEGTIYRLATQLLDVYEYLHYSGYVHADLKGANILLGYGKGGAAQAYLVDYGLAAHYTTKEFKPDPKKMHNGTIEYTSRDAHQGVPTMRADLEILGYNLIEWSGVQLPWVRDKLLTVPVKVQKAKEAFMADVSTNLKQLFVKGVPVPIADFMIYVANMKYDETPDYEKCRKMFANALKTMKVANSGDLDFKLKSTQNNNSIVAPSSPAPTATAKTKPKTAVKAAALAAADTVVSSAESNSSSDAEICASDDDNDDVVFEPKRAARNATPKLLKTTAKRVVKTTPPQTTKSPPRKRAIAKEEPATPTLDASPPKRAKHKHTANAEAKTPLANEAKRILRSTPTSAATPSSAAKSHKSGHSKPGKTIINDNLTPNARSGKVYELNLELDVSMDANVIVNVQRKRKAREAAGATPTRAATTTSNGRAAADPSPATQSPQIRSRVTLKTTKRPKRSPH